MKERCKHSGQCEDGCLCQCSLCIISRVARKTGRDSTRRFMEKLGIEEKDGEYTLKDEG